jgi:hypothetical protein
MSFTHKIILNFLTKEECELLLDFSLKNFTLEDAEVLTKDKNNPDKSIINQSRKSSVGYYPYYETFPFLLEKLQSAVEENINIKGYDFEYKNELPQFTEYKVGEYFNWHMDVQYSESHASTRHCSMVIQLNDEYECGDLELKLPSGENIVIDKGTGNLVIFLSELKHRVTPVKFGVRYTFVNWIGIKPQKNYKKTLL